MNRTRNVNTLTPSCSSGTSSKLALSAASLAATVTVCVPIVLPRWAAVITIVSSGSSSPSSTALNAAVTVVCPEPSVSPYGAASACPAPSASV